MVNFYRNVIIKLEQDLSDLISENIDTIKVSELIINLILTQVSQLKQFVTEKGFKNIDEEIYFFKQLKPNIISKLIYYNAIYKIETKKPNDTKALKKYYSEELRKLKRFFDNNLDFYRYYRTNSTYLDYKYFARGKHDIKLSLDTFYFEADHSFSTSHDYKVAKIIANDLIQVYLEDQLHNSKKDNDINSTITWTGSKVSLIELICALQEQAVFNIGNTEIKQITKVFENTFNIDLGDIYHTYLELPGRKMNRTKFIDALRDGLVKKMDEQDEK